MKTFTTIKVGYSKGVYGCSGEYLTTILCDSKGMFSFSHYGMYGSDERVNAVLQDAGYTKVYTPSTFGRMSSRSKDEGGWIGFQSETQAIETAKHIIKYHKYPQ